MATVRRLGFSNTFSELQRSKMPDGCRLESRKIAVSC